MSTRQAEHESAVAGEHAWSVPFPKETAEFLFSRAEAEHGAAERKREAMVTKATAVASLSAALVAVVAAPAFDVGHLAHGTTRWVLLAAIVCLLGAIGFAAGALLTSVAPGDRASREELENWTTDEFRRAGLDRHHQDFTHAFAEGARNIRLANERAESWMTLSVAMVAIALALFAATFVVEVA